MKTEIFPKNADFVPLFRVFFISEKTLSSVPFCVIMYPDHKI